LLHGSDPIKVELNRLENEVRGKPWITHTHTHTQRRDCSNVLHFQMPLELRGAESVPLKVRAFECFELSRLQTSRHSYRLMVNWIIHAFGISTMCIVILAVKQTLKLWRFRSGRLTAILHVNEKLCVVQDGDTRLIYI
jgi:hypothetical protein